MSGTGVIHADIGRRGQACPQDRLILRHKPLQIGGEDAHHLALGDVHADPVQDRGQPLRRHLPLGMQRETEPPQVGAKAAEQSLRQVRDDPFAFRCQPAFAPVADEFRRDRQVTNQDGSISLEARPRRGCRSQHLLTSDAVLVAFRATPPPWTAALANLPFGNLVHAGGFERRPRRQVLQPRDLIAQFLVLDLQGGPGRLGCRELIAQVGHLVLE